MAKNSSFPKRAIRNWTRRSGADKISIEKSDPVSRRKANRIERNLEQKKRTWALEFS
jgi:hypothetical protein